MSAVARCGKSARGGWGNKSTRYDSVDQSSAVAVGHPQRLVAVSQPVAGALEKRVNASGQAVLREACLSGAPKLPEVENRSSGAGAKTTQASSRNKTVNRSESAAVSAKKSLKPSPVSTSKSSTTQPALSPWRRTLRDLRDVITLRKQLTYGGYPFSRLIQNQVGDGLLAGAVAGIAVITAGVSPLLAGVLVWATRSIEFALAVVWNQHMSSQRRDARLAATEGDKPKALASKHEAAKEMVSSGFYDLLTGVAAVGAIATAIAGGPIGVVIGLGVGVAACQTLSKFKEIAWAALRFVVNPDPKLQKRMVDLQEPMSAFEMAINVGVMTLSYLASFSALAAFYVFLPHIVLPFSAGLAVVGCGLMVQAKLKFRQEQRQAAAELMADTQKRASDLAR